MENTPTAEKTLSAIAMHNERIYDRLRYVETATDYLVKIISAQLDVTGSPFTEEETDGIRTAFFTMHAALKEMDQENAGINLALLKYSEKGRPEA